MIRRILSWLLGLPALIVLLLFALANRHAVQLSFDPVTPEQPWLAIELPLWVVLFGGILLGLLAGGVAAWLRQSKWRKLARQTMRDLELEKVARRRAERQQASATAHGMSASSPATPHPAASGAGSAAAAPAQSANANTSLAAPASSTAQAQAPALAAPANKAGG